MPHAVDTHAHLNEARLFRRLDAVLARARAAGVEEIIVVGWDLPSSETAVRLAQTYQGLWAAVGIHPHRAEHMTAAALRKLRRLARTERVVAIGETGLDFYRDLSPRDAQRDAFRTHLELAAELDLPAVVHCRSAQDEVLEILAGDAQLRLVWHSFEGTVEHARQALSLGLYLGFGGLATYRRAHDLRAALAQTPRERLLLETDAPYLSPEPARSHDNEPANVVTIAEFIAKVRGETTEDLLEVTAQNARALFSLTDSPSTRRGSR